VHLTAQNAEELNGRIKPVDVFELLALADELAELRRSPASALSVKHRYRAVRLQLLEHIRAVAANAVVILRIAQFARRTPGDRTADLADQLINDALSVRLLAFMLIARLHTMWLVPRLKFKAGGVIFFYQRLLEHLSWLSSRLHMPVVARSR
jgi:hypothetical protein